MIVRTISRRGLAAIALAAVPLVGFGLIAPTPASAATPSKSPIKLMTIDSLSGPVQYPEIPLGMKAAAKAINAAGGVKGHPIQILSCDDQNSPNLAATCARKAVSANVVAVVGNVNAEGEQIIPTIAAAGIPEVASAADTQIELQSPFSFPISSGALFYVGGSSVLKATKGTSIQYVGPNVPAFSGLMTLTKAIVPTTGIKFNGVTLTDLSATDYTQPASQVYTSGANGTFVSLPSAGAIPSWVSAAQSGGFSLTKVRTIWNGFGFHSSLVQGSLKNKINGTYVVDAGQTPTDTSLPGIKTFHTQAQALGVKNFEYDDASLQAFVGVHIIANLLSNASGSVTSPTTLVTAMRASGTINYPGWVPFNWNKSPLPAPLAAAFPRYSTADLWVSKIVNNKEVSATKAPWFFTGPIKLSA